MFHTGVILLPPNNPNLAARGARFIVSIVDPTIVMALVSVGTNYVIYVAGCTTSCGAWLQLVSSKPIGRPEIAMSALMFLNSIIVFRLSSRFRLSARLLGCDATPRHPHGGSRVQQHRQVKQLGDVPTGQAGDRPQFLLPGIAELTQPGTDRPRVLNVHENPLAATPRRCAGELPLGGNPGKEVATGYAGGWRWTLRTGDSDGNRAADRRSSPVRVEPKEGNEDIAAQCFEFVVADPNRMNHLRDLRMADRLPPVRFTMAPDVRRTPDGRDEPMGDVLHMWVQSWRHRS
jgi:hypothetical protein